MASQTATPNRTPIVGTDFGNPFLHGRVLDNEKDVDFLAEQAAASATATVTVTVAGSAADVLRCTIAGVVVDTTVPATPTTTTVAAAVATQINATAALNGKVAASSAVAIVTITAVTPGLGGNFLSLVVATQSGTVAGTASGALFTGGTKLITPLDNFSIVIGKATIALRQGHPILASDAMVAAIVASGYAYA